MPQTNKCVIFNPSEQIKLAKDLLQDKSRRIVFYDPEKGIDRRKMPESEIDYESNVYAIWSNDDLMYIGEAKNIRERLRQHFITCHKRTESKLKKVLVEKRKKRTLSVSVIKVEPMEFRLAVEQTLIAAFTNEKLGGKADALPWNKQGSQRKK